MIIRIIAEPGPALPFGPTKRSICHFWINAAENNDFDVGSLCCAFLIEDWIADSVPPNVVRMLIRVVIAALVGEEGEGSVSDSVTVRDV